ncbi:MAG: sigma-54-dependent Fis family transcriptional regulator [Acidobacteria bacterium]|nr:sigma-54-dependent Fis family transcriptional regulator [Acidobacteriota bacterium]
MSALVLVVDDDAAIREMTALALEKAGYRVQRAASAAEARRAVAREKPALVVCDLYMPGEDGLSLLASLGEAPPAFLMMTARGSMETAAEAARTGAFDYLAKPFDVSTLLERAQAALATHAPAATSEEGPEGLNVSIVGSHPAIVDVYRAVARVASMRVPVLVVGETGTGKELVATALHRFGTRSAGPFVPVHCGALPDTLLESELFGHRKGAFTDAHRDRRGALQAAHGGTVFLDEIGDVSPLFQVKLLRFLEESVVTPLGADRGEAVDVRVVAATHRDLRAMVAEGRFRQDLFYRLAGYEIRIPPLRERLSDLPALVARFRALAEEETGVAAGDVGDPSPEVLAVLAAHTWPGNVRELRLAVRRIVIEAGRLDDAVVARRVLVGLGAREEDIESAAPIPAAEEGLETLEEVERRHVQRVLEASGGNRSEAARLLGIDRKTLARKLKEPEP